MATRSSTDPVVEVTDLGKQYGAVYALEDVTFDIFPGEIFALVGPNGAGKTTTVEILEGLRTPTNGTATVLGHDVTTDPRAIKERIGVVPQSFHTFDRLTVRENVTLMARMYENPRSVEAVLDRLDLLEHAGTRFAALSGGFQRRTGFAMALVSDPDVLFLDEPTTGLDPEARRTTWTQIKRLADGGTTVVLTTHYMDEVEQLADRAALLVDGSVVAVDTVASLVAEYGGGVRLVVRSGGAAAGQESETDSLLRSAATDVYRTDSGDLVGIFDDRSTAQETFGRLHGLDGDHSVELTTAGMEDVFLRLAGETVNPGGDVR